MNSDKWIPSIRLNQFSWHSHLTSHSSELRLRLSCTPHTLIISMNKFSTWFPFVIEQNEHTHQIYIDYKTTPWCIITIFIVHDSANFTHNFICGDLPTLFAIFVRFYVQCIYSERQERTVLVREAEGRERQTNTGGEEKRGSQGGPYMEVCRQSRCGQ